MSISDIHEWKYKMFKQAFAFHFNNCPEYKRYCELHKVKPEDIKTYDDLTKIQAIPSDVFRESEVPILSVRKEEIIFTSVTSSTTSKKPVEFYMDRLSLQRSNNSNKKTFEDILEMNGNGSVFFITPAPRETDAGLVKGMYMSVKDIGFKEEQIFFGVSESRIPFDELIEEISDAIKPIYIFGPPFAVLALIDEIESRKVDVNLGPRSKVLTSGGWKTFLRAINDQEFKNKVTKTVNISSTQIRDLLGLTDIFTGLPECEYHKKHVPPWFHISVRDPQNINKEVLENETGLLIYMSSLIQSYPAFCMPADLGAVWEGTCECGRTGEIVEHRGRASKLGARGCAVRLEEFMKLITKK
jgi:long-chain-fatty-acid---luciferin-component ligase